MAPAAQMISYEVSIGFIIIGVIISTGSLNFGDIVRAQDGAASGIGVMEQAVIGPYAPAGFTGVLDGASEGA